jgi:hypothetical protein
LRPLLTGSLDEFTKPRLRVLELPIRASLIGASVGKVLVEQGVPLRLVGVQVSNMKPDDSVVEAQVAQKAAEARTAAIKTLTDFLDQDPTGTRKMVYRMQVLQELTRTANANGHNTIFLTDIGGPSAGILPLPSGR